jgi:hypothetical protein
MVWLVMKQVWVGWVLRSRLLAKLGVLLSIEQVWVGWVLRSILLARVGLLQSSLHAAVLAMIWYFILGQVWVGFKLWSSMHTGLGVLVMEQV